MIRKIFITSILSTIAFCTIGCEKKSEKTQTEEKETKSKEELSEDFKYVPKFENFITVKGKYANEAEYLFVSSGYLTNNTGNFYQDVNLIQRFSLFDNTNKRVDVMLNVGMLGITIDFGAIKPKETKTSDNDRFLFNKFEPKIFDYPISKVTIEQAVETKDLQGNRS